MNMVCFRLSQIIYTCMYDHKVLEVSSNSLFLFINDTNYVLVKMYINVSMNTYVDTMSNMSNKY
jgi:hypothetical protein